MDYTIFLATRAEDEAEAGAPAATAISVALAATGGVITSAGILLAAVFTVLGVPALVALLGRWFWWPGRLSRPPYLGR